MKGKVNIVAGALIALVFIAAVGACIALHVGGAQDAKLLAVVHDGDGAVHELSLSEDAELSVVTSLGSNVVVVEDGAVFVREADCDNQDCVYQGKLNRPGKQIICLPHKLWIEIVADGDAGARDMSVDLVTGDEENAEDLDVVAR